MPKTFDIEDLKRWQQRGLLSEDQLKAILAEEGLEARPRAKERPFGLNLVTVAYYFGGILALLSFTFFVGMNWSGLTDGQRFGVAFGAMLVIGALGIWLRFMRDYPTAGGLLLFVATAVLPLSLFTLARLLGVWPIDASWYELRFVLLFLSLGSLAGALAVLIFAGFPLLSLLVAVFVHLTILDIGQIASGAGGSIVGLSAAICAGLILLGMGLTLWGKRSQALWFKLYGLVGLQITFSSLFFESESLLFGLLFLFVYLFLIGLSLRIREVIYLIFGGIGVYTYITRLVFDTFRGAAYFPLLLGLLGLSIVVIAVVYQRYGARLFRRGESS